jgi:cellulose synthase/poly-beta-1,6-N-acetylglucosamine synthase-like glycosyltransferase
MPALIVAAIAGVGLAVFVVTGRVDAASPGSAVWWTLVVATHLPFVVIIAFVVGGLIERFGYFVRGRRPRRPGRLPEHTPMVCVQLPMFNEIAVARRAIEAACALRWPRDRFEVQVLDDSTDPDARAVVDETCARMRRRGVRCAAVRRADRTGYKAGALEVGRHLTAADFLLILDADFVPRPDYLERALPHFYDLEGNLLGDLALVQAQWGHLNHDESALTQAQSLWVDDHHSIQMSWRAAQWEFVNFTGTAGVWRADAIERAGGWRADSLVEDCELSFRHLFAGYRTTFVNDVVAPAELPATFTAYKAQQRRWTSGWMQLQRLHLVHLARRYPTTALRRTHLLYHMCIPWQWPLWALWIMLLPSLIMTGTWLGALDTGLGVAVYLAPMSVWLLLVGVIATVETRHTYAEALTWRNGLRRVARIVPYAVINTGMLAHQFMAVVEGTFGPLNSEFERTPKAATVTVESAASHSPRPRRSDAVKVHWPYVVAEGFFVVHQAIWSVRLATTGLWVPAIGSAVTGACVAGIAWFYGDHVGRRCFVFASRGAER